MTGLGTPNEPVLIADLIGQIGNFTAAHSSVALVSPATSGTSTTLPNLAPSSFALGAAAPASSASPAAKTPSTRTSVVSSSVGLEVRVAVIDRALDDLGQFSGLRGKLTGLLVSR